MVSHLVFSWDSWSRDPLFVFLPSWMWTKLIRLLSFQSQNILTKSMKVNYFIYELSSMCLKEMVLDFHTCPLYMPRASSVGWGEEIKFLRFQYKNVLTLKWRLTTGHMNSLVSARRKWLWAFIVADFMDLRTSFVTRVA